MALLTLLRSSLAYFHVEGLCDRLFSTINVTQCMTTDYKTTAQHNPNPNNSHSSIHILYMYYMLRAQLGYTHDTTHSLTSAGDGNDGGLLESLPDTPGSPFSGLVGPLLLCSTLSCSWSCWFSITTPLSVSSFS